MKIYTASKFSIVIVPPKFSEKTKESKLLVRSFQHIYKVAGLVIATGLSGLLSLSQFKNKMIRVNDNDNGEFSLVTESAKSIPSISSVSLVTESAKSIPSISSDESTHSLPASTPMIAESESQDISQRSLDVTESIVHSETYVNSDLFLPFVIITIILGGITIFYFWKSRKHN